MPDTFEMPRVLNGHVCEMLLHMCEILLHVFEILLHACYIEFYMQSAYLHATRNVVHTNTRHKQYTDPCVMFPCVYTCIGLKLQLSDTARA